MKPKSQVRKVGSRKPASKQSQTGTLILSASNKKPDQIKARALMDAWTQQQELSNQQIIDKLAGMSGQDPHWVMRDLIDAGLSIVLPGYRAKQMFNSMERVMDAKFEGGKREALGFKDGKLVLCDGKTHRPIGLKQSVVWYRHAEDIWAEMDADAGAVSKWLGLIAKAL